jgi:hypothetical protein
MEEARGSELHNGWPTLELRAKLDIIRREIVNVEKQILSVSFQMKGSLCAPHLWHLGFHHGDTCTAESGKIFSTVD